MHKSFDLIVMGAGIVGLSAALAGMKRGWRVAVIEKDPQCIGASVRNFGFVTVTGQRAGEHWQRARRSRDIWAEVAPQAGIGVIHQGTLIPAYRPEAAEVCHAFLQTEMGEQCQLISEAQARQLTPALRPGAEAYLYSPHELRVESREAIPRLASWLQSQGVEFFWNTRVLGRASDSVQTSNGRFTARYFVGAPGHQFSLIDRQALEDRQIRICTLQMLRVDAGNRPVTDCALMSDLSLGRYEGFSELPQAGALIRRLEKELPLHRREGIHLIVVRSADGSLVVGDSHVYGETEAVFARDQVDELILESLDALLELPGRRVSERWTGSYASAEQVVQSWRTEDNAVFGLVTGGTGASTGFAFGEELVERLVSAEKERVCTEQ